MIISLRNICKTYATEEVETSALDNVSLDVAEGEFVSIMGPSGCGKSTLLSVLGLIDRADDGEYLFLGESVAKAPERKLTELRKQHIGFVFQAFNLIDELSVFENIELPLIYGERLSASTRKEKVNAVLEKVNMAHRANHYPRQLSGGQQQRVAVARAIVNTPHIILADEPTGNLDTEHGNDVMQLLAGLRNEGTTIITVTHAPELAKFGDRVIQLRDGRVQQTTEVGHAAAELS